MSDDIFIIDLHHSALLEKTCLHADLGSSSSRTIVVLETLQLFVFGLARPFRTEVLRLAEGEVFCVACLKVRVVAGQSSRLEHGLRCGHQRAILSFLALNRLPRCYRDCALTS